MTAAEDSDKLGQLAVYYKRMANTCPACAARPFDRCRQLGGEGFLPFGHVHTERK